MILFFDTETSGLPDRQMPLDHDCQPCVVQLAMLLADDAGVERASASMLVQPINRTVSDGAAKVTGITTEIAEVHGVYPTAALYFWDRLHQMAHTIVAHNLPFDMQMMEIMWSRFNPAQRATPSGFKERIEHLSQICTMQMTTPILNLPPTARMRDVGFDKPKPPKLTECMKHFFDDDHAGAHDAMADVRATARLYFHLMTRKEAA